MVIYKTINLINGKIYIGQDSKNDPEYLGSGVLIKKAIKKYGKENFKKEILEECKTKKCLDEREIYWIEKMNAIKEGYNLAEGGNGSLGYKHSEDTKKYLRELNLGKKQTEETRNKRNNTLKGKKRSEKAKENISKGRKEYCSVKGNCPMFGKKHSESTKQKMSLSQRGKKKPKQTEEIKIKRGIYRKGIENPNYGKKYSELTKQKMSLSHCKPIIQLDKDDNFIAEFNSVVEAKKLAKISHIMDVLKGKKVLTKGYKFIYKK